MENFKNKKRKHARKLAIMVILLKISKYIWTSSMVFTFEQSYVFVRNRKLLHEATVFTKFFLGGFGSALRKAAGSGSAKNECGSIALVLVMNEVTVGVGVG